MEGSMPTQYSVPTDARAQELLDWVAETGLPLPLPILDILSIEDDGEFVDLDTGKICNGDDWVADWLAELEVTP
jgi:hypothetical protein